LFIITCLHYCSTFINTSVVSLNSKILL
jgi:hypothetical protein